MSTEYIGVDVEQSQVGLSARDVSPYNAKRPTFAAEAGL